MDLDQFPLGAFEVDCDGSSCGSDRAVGLHVHPVQIGYGTGFGRVAVRGGKRVSHGETIKRLEES